MFPMPVKHAVWSTTAPPVTTGYWTREDWAKFEDGFRPKDYTGDRFDEIAWGAYKAKKNEELRLKLYAGFGCEAYCQPLDENLAAIKLFEDRESIA